MLKLMQVVYWKDRFRDCTYDYPVPIARDDNIEEGESFCGPADYGKATIVYFGDVKGTNKVDTCSGSA